MQLIEFQSCRPGKLAHYVCCLVQKCLYCSCILQTMVDAAHPACILDTRKTAPGLHLVDKWVVWFTSSLVLHSNNLSIGFVYRFFLTCNILLFQVLIGGGRNHRMGLFDMVMKRDNHMSVAGGIINAIKSFDRYLEIV